MLNLSSPPVLTQRLLQHQISTDFLLGTLNHTAQPARTRLELRLLLGIQLDRHGAHNAFPADDGRHAETAAEMRLVEGQRAHGARVK